jgi:hypothetical protein
MTGTLTLTPELGLLLFTEQSEPLLALLWAEFNFSATEKLTDDVHLLAEIFSRTNQLLQDTLWQQGYHNCEMLQ